MIAKIAEAGPSELRMNTVWIVATAPAALSTADSGGMWFLALIWALAALAALRYEANVQEHGELHDVSPEATT